MFKNKITIKALTWLRAQSKRLPLGGTSMDEGIEKRGTYHGFGPQVTVRLIRAKRYEERVRGKRSGRGLD